MGLVDTYTSTIYMKPGEVHFTKEPSRVITILGSCVSVVLYQQKRQMGALCHAMLPYYEARQQDSNLQREIFQYVDSSVAWMLAQFNINAVGKGEIEAKIFGGSDLMAGGRSVMAVGKKNVEMAFRVLRLHGLRITAWDVGGRMGRKIIFYTATGDVISRFVGYEHMAELAMTNRNGAK